MSVTINLTITVPDATTRDKVIDGFAAYHGYRATLPDGTPNPQTKGLFAKMKVIAYVRESVKAGWAMQAAEEARLAQIALADALSMV